MKARVISVGIFLASGPAWAVLFDFSFWGMKMKSYTGGDKHSCVIFQDRLYCWGANSSGQIGDGTTVDKGTPVTVTGGTGASCVSAGRDFTVAAMNSGVAESWGVNTYGQLGDGTTTMRLTPVAVGSLTNGVTSVASGGLHACAIVNGGVQCWGSNISGQLGNDSVNGNATTLSSDNFDDNSMDTSMWQISSVTSGVTVSEQNQRVEIPLINGSTGTNGYTLKSAIDLTGKQISVEVPLAATSGCSFTMLNVKLDTFHAASLQSGNGVLSANYQTNSEGFSTSNTYSDPSTTHRFWRIRHDVASDTINWEVSADRAHWMNLRTEPRVFAITGLTGQIFASAFCTGPVPGTAYFDNFRLETSDQASTTPVAVTGLTSGVSAVALGAYHSCALTTAGGVKCWGDNSRGQLGDGTTISRGTAADVTGLTSGVTSIVAADLYSCAILNGGAPKCWGHNASGQLGTGDASNRWTATSISGLTSLVTQLSPGGNWWSTIMSVTGTGTFRSVYQEASTCANHSTQGVKCWGSNLQGELGNSSSLTTILSENFNDNSMDTGLWTTGDTLVGVVEQNQRLEITPASSTAGSHYSGYYSNATYDLTGRAVSVQGVTLPAVNNQEEGLKLVLDSNNYYEIKNSGGNIQLRRYKAGVANDVNYGYYRPSAQQYLRIRHDPNLDYINWETSSNGSQWQTIRNEARQFAITALQIVVSAGTVASVASPITAIFDNLLLQTVPTDSYTPVSVAGLTSSNVDLGQGGARHHCAIVGASVKCWGNNSNGQIGDGTTVNRFTPTWEQGL